MSTGSGFTGKEQALVQGAGQFLAGTRCAGSQSGIGTQGQRVVSPLGQCALHECLAGTTANHGFNFTQGKIDGGIGSGIRHFPCKVASDETNHQVLVERPGQKVAGRGGKLFGHLVSQPLIGPELEPRVVELQGNLGQQAHGKIADCLLLGRG